MRCSRSDRVKGLKRGMQEAGGLEKSTSLLFSSSSSSSLRSAPDRRSLIGNEPWSRSLSRDQQIATTYRLWRGDSSPPPTSISLSSLRLSLALFIPLSSVYGEFMIYPGQCRGHGYREQGSILLLLMCQTPHLLYSSPACHDMPGLTNPPGVVMFTLLQRQPPPPTCFLPHFSKWPDVTEPHLRSTMVLGTTDFQLDHIIFLSINGCC